MRALAQGLQKRRDFADTDESDMSANELVAFRRRLIDYDLRKYLNTRIKNSTIKNLMSWAANILIFLINQIKIWIII